MIIGNGLVAKAFAPRWAESTDVVIIAAGVSNSAERDPVEFAREQRLIDSVLDEGSHAQVVYFGSCAVGNPHDPSSHYLSHKASMESLVLSDPRGLVLRLPQVVGAGGNPHTLTNFLHSRIESGLPFDVWALAERNLIDIDDVASIGGHIIENRADFESMVPVAAINSKTMLYIVQEMERVLGKSANYRALEKGVPFPIDTEQCQRAAARLDIQLGEGYVPRLLQKYYGSTPSIRALAGF